MPLSERRSGGPVIGLAGRRRLTPVNGWSPPSGVLVATHAGGPKPYRGNPVFPLLMQRGACARWPTNSLLTPSLITNETLMLLENNLVAAGKVNRQFENNFVKIGDTITVRKPNRFIVSDGPGLVIQNV